jgi:hypothetical protein
MTSEDCHAHAFACAASAALATTEVLSVEFLLMAAQWRAMAERRIFLGRIDWPAEPPDAEIVGLIEVERRGPE